MSLDAYYNSDNLMADGHDNFVSHETEKWRQQLYHHFINDLDRFPLPICFDPHEELKQLNLRKMRIQEKIDRLINIGQIRYNKKYMRK